MPLPLTVKRAAGLALPFGLARAENLLDEYPDAFGPNRNTTGNTAFSNYAPFGRAGRFVYGRVSLDF